MKIRCGMSVDPHTAKYRREHAGGPTTSARQAARRVRGGPGGLSRGRAPTGSARGARCHLHLPDAPGDRAGRARLLPDLRHGARAQDGHGRGRAERRVPRHAPPVLGERLSLPLLVWVMADHLLGLGHALAPLAHWLQLALATPVVLWAGWPIFERCWASLRNRRLWTLIGMGVGAARLQRRSDHRARASSPPPSAVRGRGRGVLRGRGGDHRAGAARQVLEIRARARGGAIKALLGNTARRVRADGADEEVPLEAIAAGDRLRVAPATRFRSTAWCSRGAARSTSRC